MGTDNHNYYNPAKLLAGIKALESIPYELKNLGAKKPLVLCLKRDRDAGRDSILVKSFYNSGMEIGSLVEDDFDIDGGAVIDELYNIYTKRGCDSIICLGNGVTANAAARLRLGIYSTRMADIKPGMFKVSSPLVPCVAVPTGTPDTRIYSDSVNLGGDRLDSEFLLPDVICIDPRMTVSGKQNNVCANALSAFTSALEILFTCDNPFVAANAAVAVKFIMKYLPAVVKKKGNRNAAYGLCNGVVAAAMAINDADKGICGLVEESYASVTGTEPGAICSVITEVMTDYYISSVKTDLTGMLLCLTDPDRAANDKKNASSVIKSLVSGLVKECSGELKTTREKLRVSPEEIKKIAAEAVRKSGKKFSQPAIENILLKSFRE